MTMWKFIHNHLEPKGPGGLDPLFYKTLNFPLIKTSQKIKMNPQSDSKSPNNQLSKPKRAKLGLPNELLLAIIQNLRYKNSKTVAMASFVLYKFLIEQGFVKKGKVMDKILKLDLIHFQLTSYSHYFYKKHNKESTRLYRLNKQSWYQDLLLPIHIPNPTNMAYVRILSNTILRTKYRILTQTHYNMEWLNEVIEFIRAKWREEIDKNRIDWTSVRKFTKAKEHIKKLQEIDKITLSGIFIKH